ncbi:restriction endonuclease subunit S [Segatella copri]|uniref:restriction endonuclease subunit S n=2 Tax=Segatella copri TaxID=165179 RepID=UPI002230DDB5|nr:restriction endonuclease subunit S [Segatella copri]MCW4085860.1 restriction endonuclease subunit S [Segatella copri]MCW4157643.1 restriction endonuclease subunit S [Segatella copri]
MNGKQLKNSILQWAIQGKLVPQDPNDEPASVLLDKIRQEKERLIKEKKIKRDKNASIIYRGEDNSYYEKILATGEVKCIDEEIPFEVPKGWEWCRFSSLYLSLTDGTHSTPKYTLSGIPFISVKDMSSGVIDFSNTKYISKEEHQKLSDRCHPQKGDLLLSKVGTTGIPAMVTTDREFSLFVSVALIKLIQCDINREFLVFMIQSPLVQEQAKENTRGVGNKNWVLSAVSKTLMVVPPLEEQGRIKNRLNLILSYVERYSSSQDKLDLLNANIVTDLKKSILQEAIQGKLVPQIAEEGTAQELLEQIKAEKQKLVKEGILKKSALNDSVVFRGDDNRYYEKIGKKYVDITEQIPFDLPDSWSWARGKSVFMPMESTKPSSDFVYIDVDAVNNRLNIIDKPKKVRIENAPSRATRKLHKNDLLFSMVRPYLKNIALVDDIYKDAIASTGFYVITPSLGYYPMFLYYLMLSNYVVDGLNSFMKGDNSPSINNCHIENYLYPLPPIEEQQRIVEKIEQLMQLLK